MRLSSLFVIVVLLISFPLLAQHGSSGAAPSAPPSPSPSATAANNAASAAASASHAASAPAAANSSTSRSSSNSSAAGHAAARSGDSKQIENDRIVPSSRIGERPKKDEKEAEGKQPSALRKKVCPEGHCEPCPAGEAGKNTNCAPTTEAEGDPCASFSGRAAIPQNDARDAKSRMQSVCATEPSGDECDDLKQQYDAAIQRYRMLLNEAPANCRAALPDPMAL